MAGIYIHIPFCKQACHYCNFHFSTSLKSKDFLVNAIAEEIFLKSKINKEKIETIYFGGGTPTLLDISDFEIILKSIDKNYKIISDPEITVEANPDDISLEKLKNYKNLSINRLSIGVQSFIDSELKLMNRAHDSKKALKSVEDSKKVFDNISVDLLYGLPNSSVETLNYNIKILTDFGPCIAIKDLSLSKFILNFVPNIFDKILKSVSLHAAFKIIKKPCSIFVIIKSS